MHGWRGKLLRVNLSTEEISTDLLPPRMTKEPMPEGGSKGSVCHLDEMLDDYYALRGWSNDGIPSPEKLAELGID
jgi:aldehyde:ferredoxin oxidoreductase